MNYYEKYLKYKSKYLTLKAKLEGGDCYSSDMSIRDTMTCIHKKQQQDTKDHSYELFQELNNKLDTNTLNINNNIENYNYFKSLEILYNKENNAKKYGIIATKLFDKLFKESKILTHTEKRSYYGTTLIPEINDIEEVYMPNLTKNWKFITKKKIGNGVWRQKTREDYLDKKSEKLEGGDVAQKCAGKDWNYFMQIDKESTNLLIDELENKLNKHSYISLNEVHTYLSGMEGFYARHHSCSDINKSLTEAVCSNALDKIKKLYQKFIKAMKYSYKNIEDEAKKYSFNLYTYSNKPI